MIFRNIQGELVEINRYDFKNDRMYYENIMELKRTFIRKMQSTKLDYLTKSKETLNNKKY